MPLQAGTRLGPYEVTALIGAGGMGEVYKARDTQLKREVALKVLPAEVAADAERLARFQREAQLLAALNHPHIAQIHGLAEAEGVRALVMELVEGPTLAERIALGPVPLDEALPIATQLAEALEYAHEHGIVHRDLKPANIKLTPDGAVKVLDFGLAKALAAEAASVTADDSPTMTSPAMTRAGVILGTAAYMAPEQARGAAVDKRADIWAFGVVLFEVLSGRACFPGDTVTDVLAAVVKTEPDWGILPADTPGPIRQLLHRCLAKDRRQRLHDIADARLEIEAARTAAWGPEATPAPVVTKATAVAAGFWPRKRALALAGATLVAGAAVAAVVIWQLRPAPTAPRAGVVRSLMSVAPADELNAGGFSWTTAPVTIPGGSRTAMAWTPDGQVFVFVGRRGGVQQLYVRRLDSPAAQALDATVGAQVPVVSADGQWIAFWADGAIRKVPILGGPVDTMVSGEKNPPMGMSWSAAGLLIGPQGTNELTQRTGTRGVRLATPDSQPTSLAQVQQNETAHILPQWLPGDRAFLYTAKRGAFTWSGDDVFAHTLATNERKKLLTDAVDARYVGGYLFFLRRGLLMAVPFDPNELEVRGKPVALVDGVIQALASADMGPTNATGAGQFSVSPTGSLAYVAGEQAGWPNARIVAVNRRGNVVPLTTPTKSYGLNVRVDPDGRRIADSVYALTEREIWVYDLERGSLIARLGRGGEVSGNRSWTPDGKRLAFGWVRPDGFREVAWQAADGSALPEKLADVGEPGGWTPDGKELLGVKNLDVWILASPGGGAGSRPIVQSPSDEQWPTVSPDGRWLAYASNASGRFEIHVQPYLRPGKLEVVSTSGGDSPTWNRNSRELFFLSPADKEGMRDMMAVAVRADAARPFGPPQPLFRFRDTDLRFYSTPFPGYDVSADGQRFFVTQAVPSPPLPPVTHIHLVLNWLEELKAKVPPAR